ncbi:hypothetical protein [Microbulbifer hydrolyticus]|nr:hypothetical protein [Microbulbifer hydrolyticus]
MKAYTKALPLPADRARALVLARQHVHAPGPMGWPGRGGAGTGLMGLWT